LLQRPEQADRRPGSIADGTRLRRIEQQQAVAGPLLATVLRGQE
jgi:hypothetical protein